MFPPGILGAFVSAPMLFLSVLINEYNSILLALIAHFPKQG